RQGGGFLAGLFGRRRPSHAVNRRYERPATTRAGFLADATHTALGVAGGFILHDLAAAGGFESAQAAASMAPPQPADSTMGFGGDFGGGDLGGGYAGGFGGDGGGG